MKQPLAQALNYKVIADDTAIRFVQFMCFMVSPFVLFLSLWKLSRLELNESQLFFGVLLSLITPLLFIIIGLLLPVGRSVKSDS